MEGKEGRARCVWQDKASSSREGRARQEGKGSETGRARQAGRKGG
jgi:hypothetical protein